MNGLISTSEREPGATTNSDLDDYPDQSATVVNDRAQMNYDGTRQPFTVVVYTNRARCFTLHYNHRK